MGDVKPLTREEVSKWPPLGPMNLAPARVQALFDAQAALLARAEAAERERDAHWANFCERSGDFKKWRAAEAERDAALASACALREALDRVFTLTCKTSTTAGDYAEYLKYAADVAKAWGAVRTMLAQPDAGAAFVARIRAEALREAATAIEPSPQQRSGREMRQREKNWSEADEQAFAAALYWSGVVRALAAAPSRAGCATCGGKRWRVVQDLQFGIEPVSEPCPACGPSRGAGT